MRPVLLVLLVAYHAFAPYCGAWRMPEGIHEITAYKWIGYFSRAFRLEAFVFISGYIFTFQLLTKNKFSSLSELAINKTKRLLIPCIIFGIAYYIMFRSCSNLGSPLRVLTGIAHLWYLPCLFWLFLMQYIIINYISKNSGTLFHNGRTLWAKESQGILLIISALPVLSILPLPIQLNKALYYMLFFFGGGVFYQNSDWIAKHTNRTNTLIWWFAFIALAFGLNTIIEYNNEIMQGKEIFLKAFLLEINVYLKIILAWTGITALYMTAVLYCRCHKISNLMLKIGACGYGVYVFHQFILTHVYYQTPLPELVGAYWLPWLSLVVTALVSIVLTLVVRQTTIGRKFL